MVWHECMTQKRKFMLRMSNKLNRERKTNGANGSSSPMQSFLLQNWVDSTSNNGGGLSWWPSFSNVYWESMSCLWMKISPSERMMWPWENRIMVTWHERGNTRKQDGRVHACLRTYSRIESACYNLPGLWRRWCQADLGTECQVGLPWQWGETEVPCQT